MTSDILLTVIASLAIIAGALVNLATSKRLAKQAELSAELMKRAIDSLKAQSLEERVQATVGEKEADVRIEMLKDAIHTDSEEETTVEPLFVRTDDGREIDLRDYDVM